MTTSGRRRTRRSLYAETMISRLWTWKPRHIPLAVVREPSEFRPDTAGVETPDVVRTLDRAVRQKLDDVAKISQCTRSRPENYDVFMAAEKLEHPHGDAYQWLAMFAYMAW
jgi:hypothetical protein